MYPNQNEITNIKMKLSESLKVIKMYEWLLDSYVLVSFVRTHDLENRLVLIKSILFATNLSVVFRIFTLIITGRNCPTHGFKH